MDDLFKPNLHELGTDRGFGNMLGIEPYMVQQDYLSRESFFGKLDGYFCNPNIHRWLNQKTIVIFPEYIGTWLALANEPEKIFHASTLDSAERMMVLQHPLKFIAQWLVSNEKGRTEAAFFRMKANHMAEMYQDVFSQLARDYHVTIVAGSIVLPAPRISSGKLTLTSGPLHNVSVVFAPDGTPHPHLISKAFPTERELPFTARAEVEHIPAFDTPIGRLGVLICADSWYPQAYVPLKEHDVDLLAVPSYDIFGFQKWTALWSGYNGAPAPEDVDINDIHKVTEAEAWGKYALAGRIRSSGASFGMNVFLRGKILDQDLGGWPGTVVRLGDVFVEEQTTNAAMLNLWL